MLLSLVIPAFNEQRRIALTLERTAEYLRERELDAEMIVVDDGSSDDTVVVVRELQQSIGNLRLLDGEANRGKGYATRRGVQASAGQYIGYMDADYKTPIEEFDRLLPHLKRGADMVIGSRQRSGAMIEVPQPLHRRLGSRVFSFIMHRLVGLEEIADTQCGFKFFQRAVALDLFGRQVIDGYMFDVEILALALRAGYRIDQVPIRWQNDPDSRYKVISGTIRNARELFRIRRALRRSEVRSPVTEAAARGSATL